LFTEQFSVKSRNLFANNNKLCFETVELKSLIFGDEAKQFLISISPEYDLENEDKCLDEGQLKSLSYESEHLNYNCFRYLLNRENDDAAHVKDVPFSWETPTCGCFQIRQNDDLKNN
jgi:hypothetical protein